MESFCASSMRFFKSLLLIALVLLPSTYMMVPEKAEAWFGCPTSPPTSTANALAVPTIDFGVFALSAQTTFYTGGNYTKECILDGVVKMLAKAVIHELVSSIINWINNGFEGGPTFVTDPGSFFGNIADEELGRFIDGSALGFVCDPFRLNIQLGFLSQRNRYRSPSRCSITKIIKNVKGFVHGDFLSAGWDGLYGMATIMENDPYGSYYLSSLQLQGRVSARQNSANLTLGWGRGFQSILGKDGKIKTPGAFIQEQLTKAGASDIDQLNLAKEFDDIVIALVNLGLSQIMSKGLR